LREERRLKVFENGVLWRIFGPKRDEMTREWRKLYNEELKPFGAGIIIFLILAHPVYKM